MFLFCGIIVFAACASFLFYRRAHAPVHRVPVSLIAPDGTITRIEAEIADSDNERARGLMDRPLLEPGTGMLFLFEEADERVFWMKNTSIPLDILFFDADGVFVSRTTMNPCADGDACPTYASEAPARYALEVNRDEPLTIDVADGWKVKLDIDD